MNSDSVVRNEDGSIDVSGSVNKFATEIAALAASEPSSESISAAVNAVCDKHEGKRIPMQALVSLATTELGTEPATLNAVQKQVHAWIRAAAKAGSFEIVKGVGGGVARLSREAETAQTGT